MNASNWAAWLALAMAYCALTYNPAYQLLLFLAVSSVAASKRQPLNAYVKGGLLMSAVPLIINVLFVHYGKSVLFTVPRTVPLFGMKIPTLLLGGPITSEAVAFAFIVTVLLLNMLVSFQVFSGAAGSDAVLGLMPKTLPAVALTSSIALRFLPTVIKDHSSIRDAQASRGVKMGSGPLAVRLRNELSVIAPTVVTSLERGFHLAESMAARGYTGRRTSYKPEKWTAADKAAISAYVIAFALTAYAKFTGATDYWPYDSAALPALSAFAVLPIAALLIPILEKDESSRS
jgi:energy-coupling factor transporter transmembrane protein EcfT